MTNEEENRQYEDISSACDILDKWADRGFIAGQIKEKYGTTRWYPYFGGFNFHSIIYPRYIYNQYKCNWFKEFDFQYGYQIFYYTGLTWILTKWQEFCYKQAYKEVQKKYPNVYNCIDYPELLE